ncbi:hypothetical protein SIN8267_00916 [Sinobacterium norvegicum]|uniref:Uncharacterized protein n=1 Tax=Sinobacterium norvegicum TaxID=1641715 RepID=A0ABN8EEI5_9GAMM|nr:hypothetical protein [Sinobacterium norvegicum]CAH0990816.1 hypothetical protein SIN8267_00916 [Sinobacterium norvegicum]
MSDYCQTDLLGLFTAQDEPGLTDSDKPAPPAHRPLTSDADSRMASPQLQSQLDIFIGQGDDAGLTSNTTKLTTDCNFSLNCGSDESFYDQRFNAPLNTETATTDIIYQGCKLGPGTNDDQPSLFDQVEPTSAPVVDSQRIINQVLEEFMPKIRAELKSRLQAAERELNKNRAD